MMLNSLSGSNKVNHINPIDWTLSSSIRADQGTSDVIAPSTWTIFGCQNGISHVCLYMNNSLVCLEACLIGVCYAGLRLFKEAKDRHHHRKVYFLSIFLAFAFECAIALFNNLVLAVVG